MLPHASQSVPPELPFAYSISQQTTTSLLLHSCTQPLHATDAQPHPPRCSNPTTRTAPYEQAPYDPIEWATPRPDRSRNTDSRSHTFGSPCSSATERFPAFGARRTRRSTARSASRVAPSRSDPRRNVDVEARDKLFARRRSEERQEISRGVAEDPVAAG